MTLSAPSVGIGRVIYASERSHTSRTLPGRELHRSQLGCTRSGKLNRGGVWETVFKRPDDDLVKCLTTRAPYTCL